MKLHELFARWLLKPENSVWISVLLADLETGKNSDLSAGPVAQQRAGFAPAPPGSPVSRLIHHHLPFGGSPRLNRQNLTVANLKHQRPVSSSMDTSNRAHVGDNVQSQQPFSAVGRETAFRTVKDALESPPGQSASSTIDQPSCTTGSDTCESWTDPCGERGTSASLAIGNKAGSLQKGKVELGVELSNVPTSQMLLSVRGSHESHSAALPPPRPGSKFRVRLENSSRSRSKLRKLAPFYFPCGKGSKEREARELAAITSLFAKHRDSKGGSEGVTRTEFAAIVAQALSLPSFFAPIIFDRVLESTTHCDRQTRTAPTKGSLEPSYQSPRSHMEARSRHGSAAGGDEFMLNRPDVAEKDGSHVSDGNSEGVGADVRPMNIDSATPASVFEPSHARPTGVTEAQFEEYYRQEAQSRCREERLFRALLPEGETRDFLTPRDFKAMLRALLMCHQGLSFLHATPEFQLRYSETVVERIFFSCSRTHNGRLTLQDMKRSRLLDTLMMVDEEEDINRERKYFSYEHFYVLYCRFWELDVDHDLQIDREDLMRYGGHSLTYRIVDRIFGGYARRLDSVDHSGFMSYTDFIWFCLSEEDKNSETAIDYWFRCVDMDGDGLVTMYDMEYFYKEQLHRMECFGHEPVQIRDILCQLLDMVKPNSKPPHIKRRDLKACRLAGSFFNVLFNLNKFFALEARDPLQIRQEHATPELTDWDRFAALEYLRLSAEEEGEEEEVWEDVHDSINPAIPGEAPF